VVGLLVAGALALVVTAVFTMAELSSRVGGQSARLHALDLIAIEVEVIRYQLGTVTILRDTEEAAARDNVTEAKANLDELSGIDASGIDLDGPEMNDFITAGNTLAARLEQQAASSELDEHLDTFAKAHEVLTDRLRLDRSDLIRQIEQTNRVLSRFGAFGGGLMAFVVPLIALYVQRRVGHRRLASYEFDADLRWLLTANEMARLETKNELNECLHLLDDQPELAARRLRLLADQLGIDDGDTGSSPRPTDIVELFANRPDFPGLRRSVTVAGQPICHADPTILSAAFTSIEWAVSQAGGDELILSAGEANDAWQPFEIRGEGAIEAYNLAEIVGPLRSIETALASTGLPVTSDQAALRWSIDVPLADANTT
jgi:hypothetical protein